MSKPYGGHNDEWQQIELPLLDVDSIIPPIEIFIDTVDPWKDSGECPKCCNGNKPKCFRGVFTCEKCGWQNG